MFRSAVLFFFLADVSLKIPMSLMLLYLCGAIFSVFTFKMTKRCVLPYLGGCFSNNSYQVFKAGIIQNASHSIFLIRYLNSHPHSRLLKSRLLCTVV